MDSGDLGYLAGGELFITGRRKDLIIKGGRNLYPQEAEEVVGDIPGIRKGCVAAFGVAEPAIGAGLLVTDLWARGRRLAARGRALGYTGYVGVLLLLTLPALWANVVLLPAGRAVARLVRAWCRLVLRLGGCPLRVEGLENLPSTGPVVLAANHASYIDSIVLSAGLPGDFRFVAKRELVTTPLVARVIRKVGHLPVERTDLSRSVADAERVTAVLRRGASLLFFPEGTFLCQAKLLPFKLGAFKAAVEARCPVIPIAIRGTREILPAYEWLLRPGPITISIGSPIRPEDSGWKEMVRLRDAARAEIARRL